MKLCKMKSIFDKYILKINSTTGNERFHASGGVLSSDTLQETAVSALIKPAPIPTCVKPSTRCVQVGQSSGQRKNRKK